jgi:hypothetical protein
VPLQPPHTATSGNLQVPAAAAAAAVCAASQQNFDKWRLSSQAHTQDKLCAALSHMTPSHLTVSAQGSSV